MMALRVQESRYRRGAIRFETDAAQHSLHVEFGTTTQSFGREAAARLLRALRTLDEAQLVLGGDVDAAAMALTLLGAFRPDFQPDDLPVLRQWLAQFADEMAAEDLRDEPRLFRGGKILRA